MAAGVDDAGQAWITLWNQSNTSSSALAPPPRERTVMEVLGNVLFVYGGVGHGGTFGNDILGDTWQFDLLDRTWSSLSTTTPGRRFDHVSVARQSTREMYIFGGVAYVNMFSANTSSVNMSSINMSSSVNGFLYTQLNDVWKWSATVQSWSLVQPTTSRVPVARSRTSAVPVGDDAFVIFGGMVWSSPILSPRYASWALVNDLWRFDYATQAWSQLQQLALTPTPRFGHAATTVHVGDALYMVLFGGADFFGGDGWHTLSDAWLYPLANVSLSAQNTRWLPTPTSWVRLQQTSFLDSFVEAVGINGACWLFGGAWSVDFGIENARATGSTVFVPIGATALPQVTLTIETFTGALKSNVSLSRFNHRMAVWGSNFLVFGGRAAGGGIHTDLLLRNTSVPLVISSPSDTGPDYATAGIMLLTLCILMVLVVVTICGCVITAIRRRLRRSRGDPRGDEVATHRDQRPSSTRVTRKPNCGVLSWSSSDPRPWATILRARSASWCDYKPSESLKQLPCDHRFHPSCIDAWLSKHSTCPMCKRDPFQHSPTAQAGHVT
ncbi:Aste57867_11190 [Aphanomyces stellatus]|uniref:Aste57867_11190 protein n=1 Tax=Aphanomyces stellatus TaxID=120398 RepID=A0A485KST1_9STRA|nr:hypothetical protein As57867_011148 [Aphanomyces stellatus]VFT88057.1 Aste57867_11190 [Aphanomyces stellatus]